MGEDEKNTTNDKNESVPKKEKKERVNSTTNINKAAGESSTSGMDQDPQKDEKKQGRSSASGSTSSNSTADRKSKDDNDRKRNSRQEDAGAATSTSREKNNTVEDINNKEKDNDSKVPRKNKDKNEGAAPPTTSTAAPQSPVKQINHFVDLITMIREEPFFVENQKTLSSHRFIMDMKNGKLSTNRAKKFVAENYYAVKSDAKSFEVAYRLYGHQNDVYGKFFEFLRIGCSYADEHLQTFRKALKLTEDELQKYEPSGKTHCYPAYFSWLITHTHPAIIAVCYALNYPIWGDMCRQMAEAISNTPKYRMSQADIAYFLFLAEPLDDMDILVNEILRLADTDPEMKKWTYKQIKDCVRMLQGYLVSFWDAIYEGAYCA